MEGNLAISVVVAAVAVAAAAVAVVAWRVWNWVWVKPKKLERVLREQCLKGNPYRFLHGDLRDYSQLTKMANKSKPIALSHPILPRALPFLHHTLRTYGKDSFAWNGPTPVVNITDPEFIKQVLNKMPEFPKTTKNPLAKLLAPGLPKYEGDKWAKHRKIMNPAFHIQKLKLMLSAFCFSCDEMLNEWKKAISQTDSCELDVLPFVDNLAGDMLSRTLFGSNYEEGKKIFQLQKEQADLTMEILRSTNIPGKSFIPTERNRRMEAINKQIKDSLRIIDKRKKAMEAGEAPKDDLLGMLLESNRDEIQAHGNNKKAGMTTEEVIDECKLIYFVGKENVSSLLVWMLIVLGQHQEWQMRARDELLYTFGKNEPDFEGLNQLKTVNMIIHEVLRLYPPVVTVSRSVEKNGVKLGELSLPAGVQVHLPIIMVHHDPEIWGEDVEFKPERFSEGVSKATKGSNSFMPFGWGPRLCIGLNFAILEAEVALAMILRRYSFQLSPSYAHAPYTVKTLMPQYGAQIVLHPL